MLKDVTMGEIVILIFGGIIIAFWIGVIKLLFTAIKYLKRKADTSLKKEVG